MESTSYSDVLDFLYHQLPMFQRQGATAYKKDLTNITALCEVLGNPQHKFRSIHIAGTNGKGTTTHILSSIFQAAGYKVGVYTSPHYLDLRERIKINNQFISKEAVVAFVARNKASIESIQPSFFEMMVAMAFEYFAAEEVDIAIIETGLGGRLDSTNILQPMLSVITNISLDHQDMLGDTLAEIAREKSGIIKENTPIIIGETQDEVKDIFIEKAAALKANLHFADQNLSYKIKEENLDHYIVDILIVNQPVFHDIKVDLKGEMLLKNVITSIKTILEWNDYDEPIAESAIIEGLANIRERSYFIGRMQVLGDSPLMIVDSAHNEDGLHSLFTEIDKLDFDKLHIVFGMVSDKPLDQILHLLPKKASYYAVQAKIPRAKASVVLSKEFLDAGLVVVDAGSVEKGKIMALAEAKHEDLVLICGSIFVVAEIQEIAVSLGTRN